MDIYNIFNHVTCEFDNDNQCIHLLWDRTNEKIDKIMNEERFYDLQISNIIYNCMWVEEIKKNINYEPGMTIYFYKSIINSDMISIYFKYENNGMWYHQKLDEEGYLLIREIHNEAYTKKYIRCNCVYNEILEQESTPFILK
jgi:hypothetical protein